MKFSNSESARNSICFVIISAILISIFFSLFESQIPGIIACTVIIAVLEYYRYKNTKAMYQVAFVDELTNLPNMEQMTRIMEEKIKDRESFILLVFDIKSFKIINDLWGYEKGDDHLIFISKKLKEYAEVFDFACRCENDVFAVILKDVSLEACESIMEPFFSEISILSGDSNYHVQYACGIVQQDGNYDNANTMFDSAKIAKAISKRNNRTKIVVYDEITKQEMIRKQQLKDGLQRGLRNDEFVVYLQPKYNLEDDTLAGAEALVRWNYAHKRFLPPGQFIPVFEEDGSVGLIDQYVLKKVSEKFKEWMDKGYKLLPISVNVSRVQLTNRNLVKDIAATVEKENVPFEYIDLELTESAAFDNMGYLLETMGEIEKTGFKISMDDFGIGYSSLGLLQKMPLHTLKLDKAFVDDYTSEACEKERLMIGDIINMAHHLGITVLAEGVETELQRDMLKEAGCEVVQGYYYSKPIPIEEYELLLKKSMINADG